MVHGPVKKSFVYGVGLNDTKAPVKKKDSLTGLLWRCPFYTAWTNMLRRCYSEVFLLKHPTYRGCRVCDEWLVFSNFKGWMSTQDWKGNHLDKDILVPGNRVYSKETCVFISQSLNKLLHVHGELNGGLPLGVSVHESGKFVAQIVFDKKKTHLGLFSEEMLAHQAWQKAKIQAIQNALKQGLDERIEKRLHLIINNISEDLLFKRKTENFTRNSDGADCMHLKVC